MINIERPEDRIPADRFALFFLAFRPFFALGALAAVVLVLVWIPYFNGNLELNPYFAPLTWHAHEMLLGYTLAIIAGFLLTAARNWTGIDTLSGWPLGLLTATWVAGRLLCALDLGQPAWLTAAVDMSFAPLVMVALARPLIAARALRNLVFLLVLAAFTCANILIHLDALGVADTAAKGTQLALYLVVLMIVILGGRVIPFFTRNPLPGMVPRQWPAIEIGAVGGVILLIALDLAGVDPRLQATLALLVCAVHVVRLSGWHDRRLWSRPIIWVLHIGYGCIALGFGLRGLALLELVPHSAAVHAFTVGGIGMMTLGMMARVSLGHTGRMLELPRLTVIGIWILAAAALVRLVTALGLWPGAQLHLLSASALLWALAFLAFCWDYWPKLCRPRIDGRPG